MSPAERYNERANFWDLVPEFMVFETFKKFKNTDRSKDKHWSNKVMWSIVMAYDRKSPMYNIPNKLELIAVDILKKPGMKWAEDKTIIPMIEIFQNSIMTQAERSLMNWEVNMQKRDNFLAEQDYTLDRFEEIDGKMKLVKGSADQLDKMHAQTAKIYAQLEQIKEDLAIEESKKDGNKADDMGDW